MASREGVDFSGTPPTAAALRSATPPRDFVVRYARRIVTPKNITATEAAYWRANRIDVAIVEESYDARMLQGRQAGIADAAAARDAVRAAGGPVDGGVIHFACDVDTTSDAERALVVDYLAGAATVLGWDRVGVYGEYEVIAWVHDHDKLPVRFLWQTYAWSGGRLHPGATLWQYRNAQMLGGVEVDFCRAYAENFGQWFYQEADMTPEECKAAVRAVLLETGEDSPVDVWGRRHQAMFVTGPQALARGADVRAAVAPLLDDESKVLAGVAGLRDLLAATPVAQLDPQALAGALAPVLGAQVAADLAARLTS